MAVIATAALTVTAGASGPSHPLTGEPLASALGQAVASFHGRANVVVTDPHTAFKYTWHADEVVMSASLYKLGVMAEAYRQSAAGLISLDATSVEVDEEDAEDDYFTAPGTTLTVREAIERAITLSDNSPARALLRLLGIERVNRTFAVMGMRDTRINHTLPPDKQTEPYNTTSAADIERFFVALYRGMVVSPAASAEMIGTLSRQKIADRLPAGLPEGTAIAHKTGNLDGTAHDAGMIFTPAGPRIAVVLVSAYDSYDDVISLDERIASLTYSAQLDDFAARYVVVAEPEQPLRGGPHTWLVQVSDPSQTAWQPGTFLLVRLQAATDTVATPVARVPLPALPPGGSATAAVTVPDLPPGTYLLQLEVFDEDLGTSGNRFPIVFEVRP